jgi:hypothetical protein|tara:strand:- start:153 stop:350 length:198 start_codon:yes stop_codon:yes gene_type:complete
MRQHDYSAIDKTITVTLQAAENGLAFSENRVGTSDAQNDGQLYPSALIPGARGPGSYKFSQADAS